MWFRKILAVILIIIFVPTFVITIIAWDVKTTFLNPNFLINQFSKNNLYENIKNVAIDSLVKTLIESNSSQDLKEIRTDELAQNLKNDISSEWLKTQTETSLRAIYNYIYGKTSTIQATIDLKPVKNALDKSLNNAMQKSVMDLPECQTSNTQSNPENANCRPLGMTSEQIQKEINKSNQSNISSTVPDNYDLSALSASGKLGPLGSARQMVGYFSLALYILTALCIFNLGLIALLIFKPVFSLLRWLATALIIPSALLFSAIFGNFLLAAFLKTSNWNLPADVGNLLNGLLSSLFSSTLTASIILNVILLAIPIGLYILASILEKRSKIAIK